MPSHHKKRSHSIDKKLMREEIRRLVNKEVRARSSRRSTKRRHRESSSEDRPSKVSRSDSSHRSQKRSLNPRKKNPAASVERRMEGANPSHQYRSRSRSSSNSRVSKKYNSVSRSPSCSNTYDSDTSHSSDSSGSSSSSSTSSSYRNDTPDREEQVKAKTQHDAKTENKNENAKVVSETDKLLMGDITSKTAALGPEIYPGIASRWSVICSEGLSKEAREKIIENNPTPSNCTGLRAPELNPEIKAAKSMSQVCLKKDGTKANTQNQVGAALTALGKAMTSLLLQKTDLSKEELEADTEFFKLFENLCDAGKLLTDVHYYISLTRRAGVSVCVDGVVKKASEGSKVDEFLFGKDFQEKLKNAQAVDKTSDTISTTASRPNKPKQFDDKNYHRTTSVGRNKYSTSSARHLNYQAPSNQSSGSRRTSSYHRQTRKMNNQGGQKYHSDRQRK